MCALTREIKNVNELFRIVKTPSGVILIEKDKHIMGRGAYLSKDKEIILLAKKRKSLNKALRTNVDDAIYDELLAMC